jgi:hypothetical protein
MTSSIEDFRVRQADAFFVLEGYDPLSLVVERCADN